MDEGLVFLWAVGGLLIVFGVFSLFFCSRYAQQKFNPDDEQ